MTVLPPSRYAEGDVAEWLHLLDSWLNHEERQPPSAETTPPNEVHARVERGLECLKKLKLLWPNPGHATPIEMGPEGMTRFGRFEIRREIGRGGFGVVYLAYDPHLNREVALKVPRQELPGSNDLAQRFHLEALAAARLDHPGLVPVLEAGTVGALNFIATPYFPGTTLAAWLGAQGRAGCLRDAARLMSNLATAVAHAHTRGVLHRDLKPANILLVKGTGVEQDLASAPLGSYVAKITDFGLAKFLFDDTGMTRTGAILGTSSYMAPEQAAGSLKEVSTATDVYALGAILYELITGRPPFVGETTQQTLEQIRQAEPKSPRALRPDVPLDLQTICLKCLRKESRQRYATAAELADDLDRFLEGQTVRARPVSTRERFFKWCRRKPMIAGLLALLTLTVLVGTTTSWILYGKAMRAHERVLAILSELFTSVGSSPVLSNAEQNEYYKTLVNQWKVMIQEEDDDWAKEKVLDSTLALGKLEGQLGNRHEALVTVTRAVEQARSMMRDDPEHLRGKQFLAFALMAQSRLEPELATKLRQLREAVEYLKPLDDAVSRIHLAAIYNDLGAALGEPHERRATPPDQLPLFREAERYALLAYPDIASAGQQTTQLPKDKWELAVQTLISIYHNQVFAYVGGNRNQSAPAVVAAEQCLKYVALYQKLFPTYPLCISCTFTAHSDLAMVYDSQQRARDAIRVQQAGYRLIEKQLEAFQGSFEVRIRGYEHMGTLSFDAAMALQRLFDASDRKDMAAAVEAMVWFRLSLRANQAMMVMQPKDEERARQHGLCWANIAEIEEKLGQQDGHRHLLQEAVVSYDLFIAGMKRSIAAEGKHVTDLALERAYAEGLTCAHLWIWYARVLMETGHHEEARTAWRRGLEHLQYGAAIPQKGRIHEYLQPRLGQFVAACCRQGKADLVFEAGLQWLRVQAARK